MHIQPHAVIVHVCIGDTGWSELKCFSNHMRNVQITARRVSYVATHRNVKKVSPIFACTISEIIPNLSVYRLTYTQRFIFWYWNDTF